MLDPKRLNLDQNSQKWAGQGFFLILNFNFPSKDYMNSFDTKKKQNLMRRIGYISLFVNFGPKEANLDQKGRG